MGESDTYHYQQPYIRSSTTPFSLLVQLVTMKSFGAYLFLITTLVSGCDKPDERFSKAHLFVNQSSDTIILKAANVAGAMVIDTLVPGDSLITPKAPNRRTLYYHLPFEEQLGPSRIDYISLGRLNERSCRVHRWANNQGFFQRENYVDVQNRGGNPDVLYLYRITEADFDSLQACP